MLEPWFLWALLGILLVGAETFIPGLAIIFFGLGALATALLCALPAVAASPAAQAVFWTLSSLLSLVLLRKRFKRLLKGTIFYRQGEDEVDSLSGEAAVVLERVSQDSPGRVRFRGTSWKAVAYLESFEPGETVRVVSREGLALVVTRDFLSPPGGGPAIDQAESPKEDR